MKYLVALNSELSKRTSSFWEKNRSQISQTLNEFELWQPNSRYFKLTHDVNSFDCIILVGDDTFFSAFINAVFYELTPGQRQTAIGFIPDQKNSAIANGLGLSNRLKDQLELIVKRNTVLMDLVRCHYIDKKGVPRSYFIINDAIIGLSTSRFPLLIKTLAEVVKNPPMLPLKNKNKQIKLYNGGIKIYDGGYAFAAVMLGNKLTNGPKLPGRSKIRCNLSYFEYLQVNASSSLMEQKEGAFFKDDIKENKVLFSRRIEEITIKGNGEDNTIIADGAYLGRVPATFSLLPKAVRVVAPMLTVKICQPWQKKVTSTAIPKPISRKSFRD